MKTFSANFYLVKGKIKDFISTTFEGLESDQFLETQEKIIIPLLEKMLKKNPKIDIKGFRWIDESGKKPKSKNVSRVYFIEIEDCKWLESGRFKNDDIKFQIKESSHNSFTFKRDSVVLAKQDAKALAKPDKEEA